MKKSFNYYCIFVLLLFSKAGFTQKTAIYTHADVDFTTGYDLFLKEKYSSAQHYFFKTIQQNNKQALVRIDAEYFSALCAVELFHNDAEERLRNFIEEHPESPRVKIVNFYLGKHYYRKKKYNDAVKWFEKTEIYDLNKEETHELYFKRGYAYFEQGKLDKAKKD
jgi:tetratricopeptide (TPR) repeat protein